MIPFVLWVMVAAIFYAVIRKLYPGDTCRGDDRLGMYVFQSVCSMAWPATAPALFSYILAKKLVDKFVKV